MKKMHTLFVFLLIAAPAWAASVKVENAWIREPAPGQAVMAGYLDLTSEQDASLTQASSPAFGKIELHEMKMQGDVMQMRAVRKINLPKGKTVKLEPGGLHLMLFQPKNPLKPGDKVSLTLTIKTGGKVEKLVTSAEVRAMGQPAHAATHAHSQHAHPHAAMPAPAKPAAPAVTELGEKIYHKACAACHASGAAGAPKLGDKTAWAVRLQAGMEALYASAIHGKGAMPPKGGQMALSPDEVKAATDYLVARSQ